MEFCFVSFSRFLLWLSDKTGARLEHLSDDDEDNNNRPHFPTTDVILTSFICNVLGTVVEFASIPVSVALNGKCQTLPLDRLNDLWEALR
jgi:hypothetical protein